MKIQHLAIFAIIFLLSSCGQSLEDAMHRQLQTLDGMSELGTVEYTITKIIKANDNAFYKVGERKILFSCSATMKAGIDLADFDAKKVKINQTSLLQSLFQNPKCWLLICLLIWQNSNMRN